MMSDDHNQSPWHLENTYASLPEIFYAPVDPVDFPQVEMVYYNETLAKEFGIKITKKTKKRWAERLTGLQPPMDSQPIALAYAGHQYGQFTKLGDGRACLLGEKVLPNGSRLDIHLKGSGPTPYSRGFDGKGTLRSMLREAIISEAMHALGVPSSRTLAVSKTGEGIRRERWHDGAVLARVAQSHLRVGTFEYAAIQDDPKLLKTLLDYAIKRHDPALMKTEQPYQLWLRAVADRQAKLVAAWQSIGFVHGVMNTDNVSIAGETIDYGPCAFLDRYQEDAVFSSIDATGRYAFNQQPYIASWNLARLAEAVVPVLVSDRTKALEAANAMLDHFADTFTEVWQRLMAKKLGFRDEDSPQEVIVNALLKQMARLKLDYTHTFFMLTADPYASDLPQDPSFITWRSQWLEALRESGVTDAERRKRMQATNPALIPRNHLVERVLDAAEARDMKPFHALMAALARPFDHTHTDPMYQQRPDPNKRFVTTCGT